MRREIQRQQSQQRGAATDTMTISRFQQACCK
jgi:hypothetical protein